MGTLSKGALAVLLTLCSAGVWSNGAPTKLIEIYNNSEEVIYPVIQTPIISSGADAWMQAIAGTPKALWNVNTYLSTVMYRAYINGTEGIAPHGMARVQIPYYTQLVPTPDPTKADQYIDWWNAVRIYLFNNKTDVTAVYNNDANTPVTTKNPLPTCVDKTCAQVAIFSGTSPIVDNSRNQLVEYTFGDIISGNARKAYIYNVDYDISYVDYAYLPVAMEPLGNRYIGYSGSTKTVSEFVSILKNFLSPGQIGEGWPLYDIPNNDTGDVKVPAAYNALKMSFAPNAKVSKAIDNMQKLWQPCLDSSKGGNCNSDMQVVTNLFNTNYANYMNKFPECTSKVTNNPERMMEHIYGWVPFNEGCKDASSNPLNSVAEFQAAITKYHSLQYNQELKFNPYVELIHGKEYLNTKAYAFSIDDGVGNMKELGTGIIITVGGATPGLLNAAPFDAQEAVVVNMGIPPKIWSRYGACYPATTPCKTDITLPYSASGFKIGTFQYPAVFAVEDNLGNHYEFTVTRSPPWQQMDVVSDCSINGISPSSNSEVKTWCAGINPNVSHDPSTGLPQYNINTSVALEKKI